MSLLDPLTHALASVLASTHAGLTTLGLDPSSGTVWVLTVVAVVVTVRLALLPLVLAARRGGCLPVLAQLPVWFALYHLLTQLAAGSPVGAADAGLAASLGAATVLGVPLAARGYLGAGWPHLAVVAGLAGTAALLSYVTQKYVVAPTTGLDAVPETVLRVHQLLPTLSAAGLLVAAGFVPVTLLVYWVVNATWTLGQTAVVTRLFPPPGAAAGS